LAISHTPLLEIRVLRRLIVSLFSRTVFGGHKCIQVQGHRHLLPLLGLTSAFDLPPLQVFSALLNQWPRLRACFLQAVWTCALPTALQISPSLCSLFFQIPPSCLVTRGASISWTLVPSQKSHELFSQLLHCIHT